MVAVVQAFRKVDYVTVAVVQAVVKTNKSLCSSTRFTNVDAVRVGEAEVIQKAAAVIKSVLQ